METQHNTASWAVPQPLRQEVARQCPQVAPQLLEEFFTQLDADYFTLFTPAQMADHVLLLGAVDDSHPVQVQVALHTATRATITVVAYDLFGAFSMITGLMATYGLNIREGQVFSYHRGPGRTTPWGHTEGGRIIDIFTVEFAADRPFDSTAQAHFQAQLTALLQRLLQGQLPQARAALNYQLTDTIRTSTQTFSEHLYPIDLEIDNATSGEWTVVDIRADDTPWFLYSLSNALAMRNIYIYRVSISSTAGKVHDRLFVGRHRGGKITSADGQRELRLIVVLIKQFTHFLTVAPDPAMALQHFEQFLDRLATSLASENDLQWLWQESTLKALATVLGSSDFLWEDFLRMQHMALLPVLKDMEAMGPRLSKAELEARLQQAWQEAPPEAAARKQAFNTAKDRELFRIDMRHLLHPALPFGVFSEELTDLAEVVLDGALRLTQEALQARYGQPLLADGSVCPFALFGLGKLGGREMGYASDIELLCVYAGPGTSSGLTRLPVAQYAEMLVHQLLGFIVARRSGIFEIDMRLRPFGSHGSLATSVEAFHDYYRAGGQAAPFERQALIKLRYVAGDAVLGRTIAAARDAFVYSLEPFELANALHLRQRQVSELVAPGAVDTKYSPGGLVDIEYTAQYMQLMHGATQPALRTPNTLQALPALQAVGLLSAEEFDVLQAAYKFLCSLIDALRLVRGNAHDLILPAVDTDEFLFLARRMGYWEPHTAIRRLAADIAHHMQQAGRVYVEHFRG